jgi:hypothetical protein
MRVAWKKKSRWEKMLDPLISTVKGRELTVNGKPITFERVAKPAGRVLGGVVVATVVSAFVSALRGQDGE